nr:hypothetical protein [Tanacetum cinerariifolium]
MKIDPHHFNAESDLIESLLNHDSSIISSSLKIDSLLDEFAGELILLKTIPPGIDETDCDPEEEILLIDKFLYDNLSPCPPEGFISENSDVAIKSFSPSPILVEDSDSFMEEIDLSFTPDDPMPPGIKEDDYNSKRDMLIFEELLSNDSLSLPENESFHFDIPSFPRLPVKPPDDDSGILTIKMACFRDELDNVFEEEDGGWICFLGDNNSSRTKKYQESNNNDGGNIVDGVKIIDGVIGSGGGIEGKAYSSSTSDGVGWEMQWQEGLSWLEEEK